jgi:hypothetical protein
VAGGESPAAEARFVRQRHSNPGPRIVTRARASALIVAVLFMLGLVIAWNLSLSVRTTLRWSALSWSYKRRVVALPPPADSFPRHIEWDGWGFLGNTVVYLVFDPSNALAAAVGKKDPVRSAQLPCDVYKVHRLASGWYTVQFYTDTSWDHCG